MTVQAVEKHEFQAEVKQLLNIVIHSLYTDKEIFMRELVSNASDALEKLRHIQLTEKDILDEGLNLEVKVTTDESAGTITIQDFGLGMTHDELVQNLGTIAHSGSKKFLEAMKEGGGGNENLIGQFGVGFYSVFMVAERVEVFSRSWKKDALGFCWSSDGLGAYSIEEVEGQRRGCKIVIRLKEECKDFAKEFTIKRILERYSNFISFPITLNGKHINKVEAIWLKNKNEIKEEEYKEFYKFQSNAFDEPLTWVHFNTDAPLAINALLFVPLENIERIGFGRMESGVALYCRKVLIDGRPKGLFPEWLRFLRGVVDSSDIPLNISRETMQDSTLIQKLNRVLTKRFLKHLEEMAKKLIEKYKSFWEKYGYFIKEGVTVDGSHREQLAGLLRFESSMSGEGELIGFSDYVSRMKEGQKEIYYVVGSDRRGLERSPYLEAFVGRGIEVLFLYEPIDDFVMNHLGEFEGKRLVSVEEEGIELGEMPGVEGDGEVLSEGESKELCEWMKEVVGSEKVAGVSVGKRLAKSPALVLYGDKMMNASMRRMMKAMKQDILEKGAVNIEINPRHELIRGLFGLRKKDEVFAKVVANQVVDNALIAAGVLEDVGEMVERMTRIMEYASKIS